MFKNYLRWSAGALAGGALLLGATGAFAGSDNSSDTYAGDVNGLALPAGTFLVINYTGYRHSDEYATSANNIFSNKTVNQLFGKPFAGAQEINSTGEIVTDILRFSYFARLWDHPLVFEAAIPYAKVEEVNIGNFSRPAGAFGPQTSRSGVIDPVLFVTYGLIADPRGERFLGFTNYFYFPARRYDNTIQVNTSTPGQYTWVPQLAYAEGLGKFAPGLRNVWVDVIANASLHTDGDSPLAALGQQFDKLTQDNSYDIKAFLRYEFGQATHVAVGIEKSWGGNQIASGGGLGALLGPTSLGKDDFLKGHVQVSFPLAPDFHVAADLTHDFEREGGLKEDFTAEVRVTKFFLPSAEAPLK
jgi:hypothetical protein